MAGPSTRKRSKSAANHPHMLRILQGPHGRRLVYMWGEKVVVDPAAISSSIDAHSWFAVGSTTADKCAWHAARVHHRGRLMRAPETACEFVGSIIHRQFNETHGELAPGPLMQRVLLAQGHVKCCGSIRDEAFVQATTQLLLDMGKKPVIQKRSSFSGQPLNQIKQLQKTLQESGRTGDVLGELTEEGDGVMKKLFSVKLPPVLVDHFFN